MSFAVLWQLCIYFYIKLFSHLLYFVLLFVMLHASSCHLSVMNFCYKVIGLMVSIISKWGLVWFRSLLWWETATDVVLSSADWLISRVVTNFSFIFYIRIYCVPCVWFCVIIMLFWFSKMHALLCVYRFRCSSSVHSDDNGWICGKPTHDSMHCTCTYKTCSWSSRYCWLSLFKGLLWHWCLDIHLCFLYNRFSLFMQLNKHIH